MEAKYQDTVDTYFGYCLLNNVHYLCCESIFEMVSFCALHSNK
jgi:hypothetical protein